MKTRRPTPFAERLNSLKRENNKRVKDRAFLSSRIAKASVNGSRKAAYSVKNAAIMELLKRGEAVVDEVTMCPHALVSVRFEGGGRLHTIPGELDQQGQEILARHVVDLLLNHPR